MDITNESEALYKILDKDSIPSYLADIPAVVEVLGSTSDLSIQEIGDGNLNYVYRVSNAQDKTRSVIVKQAVPFLRLAGESWPLARDRMRYEIRAFSAYSDLVPSFVPDIYFADEDMSTVIMQCLDNHIILRVGMIEGIRYPKVAEHTGLFMAETLFKTSAWSMPSLERRKLLDRFTMNADLCKLTEDFIFTFPYLVHESNYSNPATDEWVKENIHQDHEYKRNVLHFKELFVSKTEALLHGDLHSGSMMVNQDESYVIDTEFAFFGPISFDVGKVFSNYLLSCTSHFERPGGAEYQQWILEQLPVIWNTFETRFLELWKQSNDSTLYVSGFLPEEELESLRSEHMIQILRDAAGFAACSMARRTIGIAGVADIRGIEDVATRSTLEIFNLKLSKRLMEQRNELSTIDDLLVLVNDFYSTHNI